MIKQILAFSRQVEHKLQPLQVKLIVKEALNFLRSSIPSTIEIQEEIDPDGCVIMADPTQIHQIILNLCTNAYHSMREIGGTLGVKLSTVRIDPSDEKVASLALMPGSYVRLEVSDTGIGMDDVTQKRIFDPYFTTRDKDQGSGLGLAVVHGIVKSHQGHITVYSEPGKGTTFNTYFPKIEMEPVALTEVSGKSILGGNERIIVVDNQAENIRVMVHLLESLGYRVTAFCSSTEAFEVFKSDPDNFDLIITDMTMPQLTGAELAKRVLMLRPQMPVILCTGYSELIDREKALAMGIREYLMKPVIRIELANIIRKVLDE
ncbi:ATP-binding protein [Candidatus Riflebacteria bacterium]